MLIAAMLGALICAQPSSPPAEPWRDPARSADDRADALIARLTLDEKISLLLNDSPAIERLGIPAYDWWSECLHGVARAGRATVFPQAIGLGATFDEDLIRRVGAAIADEARAKYNLAAKNSGGASKRYSGLTFWTPNINIFRDPRWGRGQETYGEDPYLTGILGSAFVRGLQGDDPKYLKAAACAKHFAVHSGPEPQRHSFNAVVSAKDLNETYLPAFHELVKAGVAGVMCAYNRTNDEPCCASNLLLTKTLRSDWGFAGYVVSDCGAISDMHNGHRVTKDAAESAALGVRHGVNIECGRDYARLAEAIRRNLLTEHDIDEALLPALRIRIRLGLLDPPDAVPFSKIGSEVINSDAHRALAREAAAKSIVLLKNKNNALPLSKSIKRLAVVGPTAADVQALIGNYYGVSSSFVTILEGLVGAAPPTCSVEYIQGCLLDKPSGGSGGAVWMSQGADAVVVALGITSLLEGEEGDALANTSGGDRADIGLPPNQVEFLRTLRKGVKCPIIVVLTGGGPIAAPEVHELADAVLFAWYPGEQGGAAVADVVFGDVNPSGRLPVTFPKSLEQLPPFDDYRMSGEKGRTYRYTTEEPLYPFGFGLSYARFEYSDLKHLPVLPSKQGVDRISFTLKNTGSRAGNEIVQFYISPPKSVKGSPRAALKHLQRAHLQAGESRTIELDIPNSWLALTGEAGAPAWDKGAFTLSIGGCSPGDRGQALGASRMLTTDVHGF